MLKARMGIDPENLEIDAPFGPVFGVALPLLGQFPGWACRLRVGLLDSDVPS